MKKATILGIALLIASPSPVESKATMPEIREIASSAYTFAYPLVLMELTRRADLQRRTQLGLPAANQFAHAKVFPDDRNRLVIRPNADTLYSIAWLDLSREPILLHVPDTQGRYYVMQLLDAWTETFDMPGKRTRGTGDRWFAIAGPGWRGTLPAHIERVDAPTNTVWVLGRTQVNGVADYGTVHTIQNGFTLVPLHQHSNGSPSASPPAPPSSAVLPSPGSGHRHEPPPVQVRRMTAQEFFQLAADLMEQDEPHPQDAPLMRRLKLVGIVPGKRFEPESLGAEGQKALDEGMKAAAARLETLAIQGGAGERVDGWLSTVSGTTGRYGIDYDARAAVARTGLGALPPEEAAYFLCSKTRADHPLSGEHAFTLHFPADRLPPVHAFWSLTMYGEDGYFVSNPIQRFAIGDRDALKFNADGSLDLYVQHDAPGGDRDSNWLPAPNGRFNLSLRLYWPHEEVVRGRWKPPPLLD
jgi:hypothetical protein